MRCLLQTISLSALMSMQKKNSRQTWHPYRRHKWALCCGGTVSDHPWLWPLGFRDPFLLAGFCSSHLVWGEERRQVNPGPRTELMIENIYNCQLCISGADNGLETELDIKIILDIHLLEVSVFFSISALKWVNMGRFTKLQTSFPFTLWESLFVEGCYLKHKINI